MTNAPEPGQRPAKLSLPDELPATPEKLRKPWSSGMRMSLIAAGFIGLALLWSIGSGGDSGSAPTEFVDSGANAVVEKTLGNQASNALAPPFDKVDHDGVMVETGFGEGWTATASGRQVLFANHSNTIVCQSLAMPLAEYRKYVGQFPGGFSEYSQAGTLEGIRLAAEQTGQPLKALVVSTKKVADRPGWTGLSYIVEASSGTSSIRRLNYAVASLDSKNAATLSCAVTDPKSLEGSILDIVVRAYKLVPAS